MNKHIKSQTKLLLSKLENFINSQSEFGLRTITIPQQRRGNHNSFEIFPVYKGKLDGIVTEKRSMPVDTYFSIKIFEYVIEELVKIKLDKKIKEKYILKGNGQSKFKIGSKQLPESSAEAMVAKKFYKKDVDHSVDRRITVISNVLIAAGICSKINTKGSGGALLLVE